MNKIPIVAYEKDETFTYDSMNKCCEEYNIPNTLTLIGMIYNQTPWQKLYGGDCYTIFDYGLSVSDDVISKLEESYLKWKGKEIKDNGKF